MRFTYLTILFLLISSCTSPGDEKVKESTEQTAITPLHCYGMACALRHKDRVEGLSLSYEVYCGADSLHFLRQLPKLRYLKIGMADLYEVPLVVTEITTLTDLDFQHNYISRLPDKFANLTNLRSLTLLFNGFEEVPDVICAMPDLASVNLNGNPIASFPDCLLEGNGLKMLLIESEEGNKVISPTRLDSLRRSMPGAYVRH